MGAGERVKNDRRLLAMPTYNRIRRIIGSEASHKTRMHTCKINESDAGQLSSVSSCPHGTYGHGGEAVKGTSMQLVFPALFYLQFNWSS